jgi:hypothetical protein
MVRHIWHWSSRYFQPQPPCRFYLYQETLSDTSLQTEWIRIHPLIAILKCGMLRTISRRGKKQVNANIFPTSRSIFLTLFLPRVCLANDNTTPPPFSGGLIVPLFAGKRGTIIPRGDGTINAHFRSIWSHPWSSRRISQPQAWGGKNRKELLVTRFEILKRVGPKQSIDMVYDPTTVPGLLRHGSSYV